MRRISIFLSGVNFLFAVFEALVFQNHYTYANIFINVMMMVVIRTSNKADRYLLNIIWSGIFIPYNIYALIIFHTNNKNIFMEKESFFIQYVLFVAAAYIGKLMYSKYSDSRGETEDGEKRIGQKDI